MKKLNALWVMPCIMLLGLIATFIYLNVGKEECPHEIMHVLIPFTESHNLHYRATLKINHTGNGEPYWCVEVWPRGTHWWNDPEWISAGIKVPQWQACKFALHDAIAEVVQDVAKTPEGHMIEVVDTLKECTK